MGWFGRSSRTRRHPPGARAEASVPPWALVLSLPDYRTFLEVVDDVLLDRELDTTREGGVVLVRRPGPAPLQLGLQTLAQQCAARPRADWRPLVATHVDTVLALGEQGPGYGPGPGSGTGTSTGPGPSPGPGPSSSPGYLPGAERRDFESVRRLLKVRLYPAAAVDGDPDLRLIARRPADDLVAALAYDLPKAVTSVPPEDAEPWGQDEDALFALGLSNLKGEALTRDRIELERGLALEVFHGASFFVAAQLLRFEELLKEHGKNSISAYGFLVSIPTRHVLLYYPIRDSRVLMAVNALIPQAFLRFHQGPGSLSPSVYWLRQGRLLRLPTEMTPKGVTFRPPAEFLTEVVEPLGAEE